MPPRDPRDSPTRASSRHWEIPFILFPNRPPLGVSRKSSSENLRRCELLQNRGSLPFDGTMSPVTRICTRCSRSSRRAGYFEYFPTGGGEKSAPNARDRTSTRSRYMRADCSNTSMIRRTRRAGTSGHGNETERLIIVERASRVNVTPRNNLGRERVNAESGVPIVRREGEAAGADERRVASRCHFEANPAGITLIPEMLGSTSSA